MNAVSGVAAPSTAPETGKQRANYRIVCVACTHQFTFDGKDVFRKVDGSRVECSISCERCNRRIQWTEQQQPPVRAPL
jgi:hypothetical protein